MAGRTAWHRFARGTWLVCAKQVVAEKLPKPNTTKGVATSLHQLFIIGDLG
jgi:hypothetical protein